MKIKLLAFKKADGTDMYPNWKIPVRQHANDVGADVFSPITITLNPHESHRITLGFGIEVPAGYAASIFPKSGLSSKGLLTSLSPIDPNYTGSISAIVQNTTDKYITIQEGTAIGQLVVYPVAICEFVTDLGESRGDNGFGSTDKEGGIIWNA